jgi:transposase InsO family protein
VIRHDMGVAYYKRCSAEHLLCLGAILDVASRKVLSFRVSNTMSPDFCVMALQEAIPWFGAGDHERRSGLAVFERAVNRCAQGRRHQHQLGRQGSLNRQRFYRKTLAPFEIWGRVYAGLREWARSAGRTDPAFRFSEIGIAFINRTSIKHRPKFTSLPPSAHHWRWPPEGSK